VRSYPEGWRDRPGEAPATRPQSRCQFRQADHRLADERDSNARLSVAGETFFVPAMRTVFWEDDTVRTIDQRLLPERLKVLSLSTVGQVADAIRDVAPRGNSAIGAAAALARTVQPP